MQFWFLIFSSWFHCHRYRRGYWHSFHSWPPIHVYCKLHGRHGEEDAADGHRRSEDQLWFAFCLCIWWGMLIFGVNIFSSLISHAFCFLECLLMLLGGGVDFRTMVRSKWRIYWGSGYYLVKDCGLDCFFHHGGQCRLVKHVKIWESISKALLKFGASMGWTWWQPLEASEISNCLIFLG